MSDSTDILERRTSEVGEHVGAAAHGLHAFADELRESAGGNVFSAAADEVARRGEGVASYLRNCTTARLIDDAQGLAQRAPLTAAAVALIAGFAASRALKLRPEVAGGGQSQ